MPKTYITTSGDMWDLIALNTMGSETYKNKLMQVNRKHRNFYIFPAGIELVIPEVTERRASSLPPWKRGNAT